MNKIKTREILAIHMLAGFLAGLFLNALVIILATITNNITFTFFELLAFHKEHPYLIFIDIFSMAGILIGFYTGKRRITLLKSIGDLKHIHADENIFIKSAIQDLTKGNLNAKYKNTDADDEIVNSLKALQSRLIENRETEKETRKTDKQSNWTSEGLASFGDILRSHSSNRNTLAYEIISSLVRYLDINQGGFFIKKEKEGELFLEMIACHAYNRNKFPDQIVNWGDGILGAVAIEKKSYYTDKVPDDYLMITSGLGRANPKHLLIVPLVLNEEVYGVFELASFKKFEDFEIQFVERVAENTATTLSIMESNFRTEQLLKETQEQASKLASQEEKVRQNIEELKATQIEAAKQSEQFISFTNTVNHTLVRAEYKPDGTLIYANTRFLRKLGYSGNREVEGKPISEFINKADQEWFNEIWSRLASGGQHYEGYMRHVTKMGMDLWTMATYTCVRKDDGEVEKILFLAIDTTEQKEEMLDFEGQINAINKLSPKAEFSPDGRVLEFNELFEKTLKFQEKEIHNKNIFDFLAPADQERFSEIWEQVISGTSFQGQIRMLGKFEEEIWLRATFTTVADMYGELDKIVFLGFEITKEKQLELSMRNQNEVLKEKEEEMRLQSLDLRKQIDDNKLNWDQEKEILENESQRFRDILDQYPEPVVSLNNQGFIIFFNEGAEKYWKLKRNKVINSQCSIILSEKQDSPILEALIDPGKVINESRYEQVKFYLADLSEKTELISLIKTESGREIIYTLIIHK